MIAPPTILLVSLGRNGGLPKYAAAISEALEATNHRCISLCASGSEHPIAGAWSIPTYRNMLTLVLSSLLVLPLLLLFVAALRLVARVRVVYFPYVHTWTPVLLLWSRLLGCRAVVTFHDYRPHFGEAGLMTRLILWAASRLATHFIFLSAHVRDEAVLDRACIAKHSVVIPHGIFSLPGLTEKNENLLRPKLKMMLFLGRVSPYKGIEILAEAFGKASLPGCRLVIAGKSNYQIDLASFPQGVEVMDRFLDEAEMAVLLNEADVLVLPYLEATQSGIVTLGIDSATPMVCTRVAGLSEQLAANEALFCSPDVAGLVSALREISRLDSRVHLCNAMLERKRLLKWPDIANQIFDFCEH